MNNKRSCSQSIGNDRASRYDIVRGELPETEPWPLAFPGRYHGTAIALYRLFRALEVGIDFTKLEESMVNLW